MNCCYLDALKFNFKAHKTNFQFRRDKFPISHLSRSSRSQFSLCQSSRRSNTTGNWQFRSEIRIEFREEGFKIQLHSGEPLKMSLTKLQNTYLQCTHSTSLTHISLFGEFQSFITAIYLFLISSLNVLSKQKKTSSCFKAF